MYALRSSTGRLAVRNRAASVAAICIVLVAIPSTLQSQNEPAGQSTRSQTILRPEANRLPDANDIMTMRQEKVTKAKFEAANLERKRQIDSDSDLLLRLVTEVKAELDQGGANGSPSDLQKKMEQIQSLAHSVQVKMKLTMSAAQ